MNKKIITIGLLLITSVSFGQLNEVAEWLKKTDPEQYQCIKSKAIKKWVDNHEMIVYEINNQAKAYDDFGDKTRGLKNYSPEFKVCMKALEKWSNGVDSNGLINTCTTNWEMVNYEIDKQLKAMNSY